MDFETDTYLKNNFNANKILTIQNVESFYNYQTIDSDFKLVTSVLSGDNHYLELRIRGNNEKTISNEKYVVIEEELLVEEDINLDYLKIKKSRINSALLKIRENLNSNEIDTNNNFFDYFSLKAINQSTNNEEKPKFCTENRTKTKRPCSECNEICSFPLEMILHPKNPIRQADILEELRIHKHPSSRIMENGTARITSQAANELAEHYVYAHKMKMPNYII